MTELTNKYNLEERTSDFGRQIIRFCRTLSQDTISKPLISQIVRSATSIGANYMEANGAVSKKDFINKISLCKKEAQETRHWLKMFEECFPEKLNIIKELSQESHELSLIFQKIFSTAKNNLQIEKFDHSLKIDK